MSANQPCQIWAVPFWAVVIALTLVLAYLLLFNPRVVKPKVTDENLNPESKDNAAAVSASS